MIAIKAAVPVSVIVYHPQTKEGREELAKQAAQIHAEAVMQRLWNLHCPTQQKRDILNAIIHDAEHHSREQDDHPAPGCCYF